MQRMRAGLAVSSVALLSIALSTSMTCWMHRLLSYSDQRPQPPEQPCAVAIVLGFTLHRNGTCTQPLKSRVEVGVRLFEQGAVERLIFSGAHPGSGLRNVSEANAMSAYAKELAYTAPEPGRWLLEEASTSTRTNALYSLDMAQSLQMKTIVLVTSPFHQWRSYLVFRNVLRERGQIGAVKLYVARAPCAGHRGYGVVLLDALMDQIDFWRELVALAYYGARGWL